MTSGISKTAIDNALLCFLNHGFCEAPNEIDSDQFLATVRKHWIAPLLHTTIRQSSNPSQLSPQILRELAEESHAWAIKTALRQIELTRVIERLAERNLDSLLLKGAALAFSHYSSPFLRPACDVDLFVSEHQSALALSALEELGYTCYSFEESELKQDTYQRTCERRDENGFFHRIDLHWKVSGYYLYADLYHFDELFERSVAIPQLGKHARTLAPFDALVLACTHRTVSDSDRLLWLCDIDRIVRSLTEVEESIFQNLAKQKRVKTVCLEGLELARFWFGTPLNPLLVAELKRRLTVFPEVTALTLGHRKIDRLLLDVFSIRSWRARIDYLSELLFPRPNQIIDGANYPARASMTACYLRRFKRKFSEYMKPSVSKPWRQSNA
jgi:Uncharacterised nucleotidyltransferase